MYINKKDKEYIQQLIFKDYCMCKNTKEKALKENNFEYADQLMEQELYLKELLLEKFKMNENHFNDLQNKMYLTKTY